MRQLARTEPALSPRELLETVTANAAAALGQQPAMGRSRAAFAANVIAVPWHGGASALLDNVTAYGEKIPWLMVGGTLKTTG